MGDDTGTNETEDRFRAVDSVAEHIFETMPLLSGQYADDDAEPLNEQASLQDSQPSETFLEKTERMVGAFVQVLEDGQRAARGIAFENDISFYAARRRSQLPEGIELLEGAPSPRPEDEMLASIRALIDEQDAEQYAVRIAQKRRKNLRSLPPLAPQAPVGELPTPQPCYTPRKSLTRRMRASLRQAFRKDFFLASALSVWTAMALAVFIEPSVSGMLFATSLFLLFVASCLFPEQDSRTREAINQPAGAGA